MKTFQTTIISKVISFRKTAIALCFACTLLASCTSENDITKNSRTIDIGENFEIVIKTEAFNSDVPKTKSRVVSQMPEPRTVTLRNGMEAELSVERDASEENDPKTRAPISDGHYTIYAIDKATGNMVTGADSELKGTFTNGSFTRDAGSKLFLAPGTYIFVCRNDAVTLFGNKLYINNGDKGMIGTTEQTVGAGKLRIAFTMRHKTARLRFRIVAYANASANAYFSFYTIGGLPMPSSSSYNLDGTGETISDAALPMGSNFGYWNLPATSMTNNKKYPLANDFLTEYFYYLPNNVLQYMYYQGSGTVGALNLSDASTLFAPATLGISTMKANESYTINIKLKYKVLYLFDDGTVGTLAEKGTRTPVAVSLREKTLTKDGLAVALTDATSGAGTNYDLSGSRFSKSLNVSSTVPALIATENGYDETWNPATNRSGSTTAKGDDPNLAAFYLAGHYQPVSPLKGRIKDFKWHLPAYGEWGYVYSVLGGGKVSDVIKFFMYNWPDVVAANTAFTQAGGTALLGRYWSSSEYSNTVPVTPTTTVSSGAFLVNSPPTSVIWSWDAHNYPSQVRPFINY